MPPELEIMHADDDGWSEWVHPTKGYLMGCCDCGLVHELEFKLVEKHDAISIEHEGEDEGHVIVFRAKRVDE